MNVLKRTICLCLFFHQLFLVENLWALPLNDTLAMLGYSDEEIAAVLSRKTLLSTLRLKHQMEMLGHEDTEPSPIRSVLLHSNKEIYRQQRWHEKFKPYSDIIKDAAERTRLKESLLMAVIKGESDFNAKALSTKGAIGLMQIMPETAKDLGLSDPFDPSQNIHGGAKYLSDCIRKFKDLRLGLAAYNAGPSLVAKLQRIPSITETQKYVRNVMRYIKIYDRLNPPN